MPKISIICFTPPLKTPSSLSLPSYPHPLVGNPGTATLFTSVVCLTIFKSQQSHPSSHEDPNLKSQNRKKNPCLWLLHDG